MNNGRREIRKYTLGVAGETESPLSAFPAWQWRVGNGNGFIYRGIIPLLSMTAISSLIVSTGSTSAKRT